ILTMLDLYTIVLGLLIVLPLLGNIFFPYLWLDLVYLLRLICMGYRSHRQLQRNPPYTLLDVFLEKVKKHPKKPLILFGEEVYSYQEIDRLSSQAARVLQSHVGLKKGETVAVFLKNVPAYIWIWIGLEKIGCIMACVNYNLRSKSLLHVLSSCEAKVLLTTPDFQAVIEDVLPTLKNEGVQVFYLSDECPTEGVEALLGQIKSRATFVLRSKFSASHFWDDCRRYHVTVIQYVGEMMRYLCNSPKKDNDRDHSVRLAIGNGMRIEVWKEFLRRFGFVQIYEFYGATEGNIGFINYTGKVGAVGRTNFLHKKMTMFELVKYNVDQDEPVRNEKGYCIPVALGETGLLVAKITDVTPFSGYAGDRQKSEKKILQDVLRKGDSYFNTGDLLMQDHEGFMYFQDRVGDTFRWKGENVATTEVERTLAALDFIEEVNVYGVPVPGHEGKTGMAAVRLKEGLSFDGKKLYAHVKDYMPNYAIPRFVRLREALEITGTFKQCKGQLVNEGFDPALISDPLYFLDDSEKCYVPMTHEIFSSIAEKKLKL
ncbi:hypothetical protein JD844_001753, partial [Phrynosoma platyrhinos]